jgi:D-arginine dehydrogenase
MLEFDVIVVGAGIAGVSIAAELSRTQKVLVLEAEAQPAYHSTGRSAALFSEMYGNELIRGLSRASRQMFFDPPEGFVEAPLAKPRGALFIGNADQAGAMDAFWTLPNVASHCRAVSREEALSLCPILRKDYVAAGILEVDASDLDVHGLQQAYLRVLRRNQGVVATDARVTRLQRKASAWHVATENDEFRAGIVINASGAWADEIAGLAGAAPIGLLPCRRTAILVDAPEGHCVDSWPLVIDIDEQFYFKPDAGLLMLSPADETPAEPGDAQPEEWDVAVAIDRVATATSLDIRRVKHKWAGLRSFVRDRSPVAGFDPAIPGFFWLAGQGGYGVQTAPALARAAAALAQGRNLPEDIAELGIDAGQLTPSRLQENIAAE